MFKKGRRTWGRSSVYVQKVFKKIFMLNVIINYLYQRGIKCMTVSWSIRLFVCLFGSKITQILPVCIFVKKIEKTGLGPS